MKDSWFYETLYPDIRIGLKVKRKLYSGKTRFQDIRLLETPRFGKVLVLDGVIQTTSRDEFIYHEMMTHIPIFSHPGPKNVLVIGGGDGGVLREALKHKRVEKITLVEIDEKVIQHSKKHLAEISQNCFQDRKVELVIADGAEFVKNKKKLYQIAIIDSPDPIGPGEVLFKDEFYQNISHLLTPDGIMVRQSGSTFLQEEELRDNYQRLKKFFKYVATYTAAVPTYIGGLFSFIFCSKEIDPQKLSLQQIRSRYSRARFETNYYNPEIHIACFKLPNYLKDILGEDKK